MTLLRELIKAYRPHDRVAAIFQLLVLLSVIALLPWQPEGPFDARSLTPVDGFELHYPLWGALLEPLFAPGHLFFGAPDFRLALLSLFIWLVVGSAIITAVKSRRHGLVWWHTVLRALGTASAAVGVFLAYLFFAAFTSFPGWELVDTRGEWLFQDLQSHTYGSHDGIASAAQNLAMHRARGYEVVAITEHNNPVGAFAAQRLSEERSDAAPAVIAGVEVSDEYDKYLLGLGLDEGQAILGYRGNERDYARRFIAHVHEEHDGAVIAMAWHLEARDVIRLVEAGVDGFEISNTGHPDIPREIHRALLAAQRDHGVRLVSSSDWHGWGGIARNWTAIPRAGLSGDNAEAVTRFTVDALRGRGDEVLPISAGYIGPPPLWRVVFTPLVEGARYAAELSLPRVLSWWLWIIVLVLLAQKLRGAGYRAGRIYGAAALAAIGGSVLGRGWTLVALESGAAILTEDAVAWGEKALIVGSVTVIAAVVLVMLERRRLRQRA